MLVLLPMTAISQDTVTSQQTRIERENRTRMLVERERTTWRNELQRHEEDCRRERDRINREHEDRIDMIMRDAKRNVLNNIP